MTQPDAAPGVFESLTLADGATRYTLSLPGGIPPAAPAPLVICLHYGGPVSPWYGRGLLESVVEPALRELNAVMIAPDCPAPAWSACASTVLAVIDEVSARYNIAQEHTLLTGYSKGGIGTWALASAHPERFSAAVVMAGSPPRGLETASWQVPTHVIQAEQDEVLPVGPTVALVEVLRADGAPVELETLPNVTHFETHSFVTPLTRTVPWLRNLWFGR